MDEMQNEEVCLTEEETRFRVTDDQTADWAVRKILEIQGDTAKWEKFYGECMDKIRKANDFRIEYMKHLLQEYFYTVPHKMAKTQSSYQLPSGKLVMKAQAPDYERDDELILAWLKANERSYVKTKEVVDWAELKKTLTIVGEQVAGESGEIIPGITVIERPNVFKVEVK